MEEMGRGSIPLGYSGYKVQPFVSQAMSEISIGIKYNKEALMEARELNRVTKKTVSIKARASFKVKFIVALVAIYLLAAPSTRDH